MYVNDITNNVQVVSQLGGQVRNVSNESNRSMIQGTHVRAINQEGQKLQEHKMKGPSTGFYEELGREHFNANVATAESTRPYSPRHFK
ncbi:hypothetical protein BGZ99_001494 [Dissophora globulifera]|uniref:Uncharacterized protein n=1 Tax=Dissophora globulifera TaxID=979702 RepID=A0A9P6RRE1_9FUNG|nr:hypothetical protein BGZ99_001494 [Dissophora globulifera]